jgi:hypothetical protein
MSGLKLTLLLALLAMAVRTGLFHAGVTVAPFGFILAHLLFVIIAAWYSGHHLLGKDPGRGFGELLRAGFQSALAYAFLIALFTWAFYTWIDTKAFTDYNEQLVHGFIGQGQPEQEARVKVGALYNAGTYAYITFFGLFLLGSMNALLFGLLHHKLLRKLRR